MSGGFFQTHDIRVLMNWMATADLHASFLSSNMAEGLLTYLTSRVICASRALTNIESWLLALLHAPKVQGSWLSVRTTLARRQVRTARSIRSM